MQTQSAAPRKRDLWRQRAYDRLHSTSGVYCAKKTSRNTYAIFLAETGERIGLCWAIVKRSRHVSTSVAFDGMPIYVSVACIPDAIDEAIRANSA